MKTIKGFFQWIGTAVEEDSGKVSVKRIGFLALLATAIFITVHYTKRDVTGTYDWMQCLPAFCAILGAAFALVGLTYVPTRFTKNTPDVSPSDSPKITTP